LTKLSSQEGGAVVDTVYICHQYSNNEHCNELLKKSGGRRAKRLHTPNITAVCINLCIDHIFNKADNSVQSNTLW